MSTIYLRGRSVWIGFTDRGGRRRNVPTGFKVQQVLRRSGRIVWPRDVLEFKRRLDLEVASGRWGLAVPKVRQLHLSDLLEAFHDAEGLKRRPATKASDRFAIQKLQEIVGDVQLSALTEEHLIRVRDAIAERTSLQTAALVVRTVSPMFRWAVERGIIDSSPVTRRVRINPPTKPVLIFSDPEVDAILELARSGDPSLATKLEMEGVPAKATGLLRYGDPDLADQLEFLVLTGFRSGESCGLHWSQVNFETGVIEHHNVKGAAWERFPLDAALSKLLVRIRGRRSPWVFRYRHVATLNHRLKILIRALGLDQRLNVHTLKKTYVSRLVRSGVTATEAHVLAHHRSFQTTLRYYVAFDIESLRAALARSRKG